MTEESARILVIDDEPGVRDALEAILRDEGFRVETCESGEAALEVAPGGTFDALFLDVWLPGIDGLETLTELRQRDVDGEVIMISGHGTIETAVRATKLGAFDFVEKPLSLEKTLLVLRNALRQRRLRRVNARLLEQLGRDTAIVGRSAAAERLRREIETAAGADLSVWIEGEPGSGRQNVARRIHALGADSDGPFVDVFCGALDVDAQRSALFGAEGGRLRLAGGGTLMLADVDRLTDDDQRRLADVLNTERTRHRFRTLTLAREDAPPVDPALREALAVIRVRVPPLRERREDIPEFAERFLDELGREYGGAARRWSPDALAALTAHDWPGNVAELRNVVEHAFVATPGEYIEPSHLPLEAVRDGGVDLYGEFDDLSQGVDAFRRYQARTALERAGGDVAAAAGRLGVEPDELRRLVAGRSGQSGS